MMRNRVAIALVLALLGPLGIGQFYLGCTRRAFFWLLVPFAVPVAWGLAFSWLGAALAWTLLVASVVFAFGAWAGAIVDIYRIPRKRLQRVEAFRVFVYWVGGICLSCLVTLPLRMFVVEAFKIPSVGVYPTLLVGDRILADKLIFLARKPKRGEMIVFQFPEKRELDFVKRVIAIPGDRLEVKKGHPWLNGWEIPHCLVGPAAYRDADLTQHTGDIYVEYLDGEAYLIFLDQRGGFLDQQGPYMPVAKDEYWVLGDNRHNSHDSRMWFGGQGGGVPLDHVRARAHLRWFFVTEVGVAWSRVGTSVGDPLLPPSMEARSNRA